MLLCLLARNDSGAAHVPAACQCATAGYNPVCADGITWASPCDALCTGRPCYSSGVCQYNAAKATFTPTTGGTSAAGGRLHHERTCVASMSTNHSTYTVALTVAEPLH